MRRRFPRYKEGNIYFEECQVHAIYVCHCTDLSSKISLVQVVKVEAVGVGLVLNMNPWRGKWLILKNRLLHS